MRIFILLTALLISTPSLSSELEKLGVEIKEMISDLSCDNSEQCKSIGFGARGCGGYNQYLLYSTKTTYEVKLDNKAQEYFKLSKKHNEGLVSICSIEQARVSECVRGKCEDMGDELNYITPIHFAAAQNNIKLIKELLREGKHIDTLSVQGETALQYISGFEGLKNVSAETIKFLISKNADINAKGKTGNVPLISAITNNHVKAVKILIENGADITIENTGGYSPLYYAKHNENKAILKMLQP